MTDITHELKILPDFFEAFIRGDKNFEIRNNEHDFKVGEFLVLNEWTSCDYAKRCATGRSIKSVITYVTDFAQRDNFVVMGIRPVQYMKVEPNIEI